MNQFAVKVSSVTYALKAKNCLNQYNLHAKIAKNPHPKEKEGCGYVVFVYGEKEKILSVFEEAGIPFKEVQKIS